MTFRKATAEKNPYAKKRRRTLIIISAVVISLFLSGLFIVLWKNKEQPTESKFSVCDLTQEEVIENFKDYRFSEKEIINDYFFYGESLSLFSETYNILNTDDLVGKTLLLTNICTEEEFHYLIDYDVDGQIPLENLPKGLYEVFINVDMVKKRVTMPDEFLEQINLVNRHEDHRKVSLMASQTLFDDAEHSNYLNDNYLFINVEAIQEATGDYDIVIDPAYGVNVSGYFDEYGKTTLGLVEADELYSMALLIQEKLEDEGFKVLITRDSADHIINQYGEDGRFAKAYASNAKYYVELSFNENIEGALKVYKSSYASQSFASFVADHLLATTNLVKYGSNSVVSANRFNDLDGVISVREMGGKALGAATFSELAEQENKSFAFNNRKALETIAIEYLSFANESEIETYKKNKEIYAEETANALIEYFRLGEKEVEHDLSD